MEVADLGDSLASVPPDAFFQSVIIKRIMQSVVQNSPPISAEDATPFHALSIPEITVQQYLERYMNLYMFYFIICLECSNICYVLAKHMSMQ
jgi:hypothetical protein